ncbi:hypothetical protein [Zobellia sp. B3R18]|uniref:hypothetical protein n=1 Tax=Zobellia sp. B3R18 TaxID=2841568 RepID=UPI001C07A5C7|nr:hypothetical protein [Zobellia sp. B3R18]MBU2974978.1 hypothetical protein [Zobellia sp. B3R18]
MKKRNFFNYLIDFLIVAFGVFLGTYVSQHQTQKKIIENKIKSVNFILDELKNNRENLLKVIEYHELIKISFDSIQPTLSENDLQTTYFKSKKFNHNEIKEWKGFQLAEIESIAFETVKISGIIQEMDIEMVKEISKIYKQQENYSNFSQSIINRMLSIDASTKTIDVLGTFQLFTNDVVNYEKLLLLNSEKGIEKIQTLLSLKKEAN